MYEKWLAYRALALEEGRQSTLAQIRRAFKKDVIPPLRQMTIHEITRHHLLEAVGRIESAGRCRWPRRFAPSSGSCSDMPM
ncbi:phage integrase central domain-containing protein [Paraburkholderia xenovorans]|uniref:phage integrase central domain-containing protein n=1 Tax=Paraburkholderia xenovorans TaxID=36873 RepID=UPI0002D82037